MSALTIAIIASLSFGLFFLIISLVGKQKDYLLDDYNDEDLPDNVRIIERDVHKIVEKEVIKEVEIENTDEVNKLNEEIREKNTQIDQLNDSINELNYNKKSNDETIHRLKEDIILHKNKINTIIDNNRKEKEDLNRTLNGIKEENDQLSESMNLVNDDRKKLFNEVSVLNKEIEKLNQKVKDTEKELRENIKSNESKSNELMEINNSVDKIITDRDYFINLLEKKEKELSDFRHDLNYEYKKHPNVYEGTDEYGSFYDISKIDNKFPIEHIKKIKNIISELEPNQFVYYAINTKNGYENTQIYDVNDLDKVSQRLINKKSEGKYRIYIVLDCRVYHYDIN